MQAKLPDVNAAIVRHRSNALKALESNDREIAAVSLNAINALLPEDYKVEVSTEKYEQAIQSKHLIVCTHCDEEVPIVGIKTAEMLLPATDAIIFGKDTMLIWFCPKCKEENSCEHSKRKTVKFSNPIYTKIVPNVPPIKGLINRVGYESRFRKWFDITLSELEQQISLYRTDWQAQQGEEPDFKDLGDAVENE